MNIQFTIKQVAIQICTAFTCLGGVKIQPVVLMYHSFDTQNWKHGVLPEELEKQIIYLQKKRDIVFLSDIITFVKGENTLPNNAVAITVDDGYEDTYTILYPLAKKYNFSFTLFLTTDLSVKSKLGNLPRPTWEQLKEMSNSGLVDIQVHGHSHINFTEVLAQGSEYSEIEQSRRIIEEKLDTKASMIAYPAGEYDKDVIRYISTEKYDAAFSTYIGPVNKGDDLFTLRRILVDRVTSFSLFKSRLSTGFPLYIKLVHFIKKRFGYYEN